MGLRKMNHEATTMGGMYQQAAMKLDKDAIHSPFPPSHEWVMEKEWLQDNGNVT